MNTVKNAASALKTALHSKGIAIKHSQALDVLAQLGGTKDWNAFTAMLAERRSTLALRRAVENLLGMAAQLAYDAGNTEAWNNGGFAREACKTARAALEGLPHTEELDGSVGYIMAKDAEDQRLWIGVDGISVYIRRNDEGVSVDLFAAQHEDEASIASTYALFHEADTDQEEAAAPVVPESWVIYSRSEAEASDDNAGFWSNDFGWSTDRFASTFTGAEKEHVTLPVSAGNDAVWINLLKPWLVALTEKDAEDPILFECYAENHGHAQEQAENAYPECDVHGIAPATTQMREYLRPAIDVVQQAYGLIASAAAWQIDDSPLITSVTSDALRGDPENEVFYFTWSDGQAELFSERLTEDDLASAVVSGNELTFPDADGGPMVVRCFEAVPAGLGEPKGVLHICGLGGEHFGVCPACEEAKLAGNDLVAEWVGLHYGVDFEAEPKARKNEWYGRFMEAHAEDNPLFSRQDWEYEVASQDTRLGYLEWLAGKLESQYHDREIGIL